ncbi:MAG: O-antigen ligase family protein [Verrucomicrobiota bacterium]
MKWDPHGFGAATVPLLLFIMPQHWVTQRWILLWTLVALWRGTALFTLPDTKSRRVLLLAVIFLGWMWSSMFRDVPNSWAARTGAVLNAAAITSFLAGIWRVARRPSRLDWMLRGTIGMAVLSALISIPVFYGSMGKILAVDRLENVIPYCGTGLYAVNSALLWAFAAVAAAAAFTQTRNIRDRTLLLSALAVLSGAVFLTQTRGALLGIGAGMLVLILTRPVLRWSPALSVIAVAGWMFQNLPAILPKAIPHVIVGTPPGGASPTGSLIARSDSGRFALYKELWSRIEGTLEIIFGRGFWARDNTLPGELSWQAPHPHGAFISTGFHGGIVGLVLLGILLHAGAKHCAWLAKTGLDVRWLALLAMGCASLCFDGHTLALMTTIPLFEPLLFWLPLLAGASLAVKIRQDTPPPMENAG